MPRQIIPYFDDEGRRKWAIWSTITDDFVAYDMRASEVVEYEARDAYEKQKRRTLEHMKEYVDEASIPYFGYSPREFEERLRGEYEIGESEGVPNFDASLVEGSA
jgi:hypothetical protein